MLERKIALFAPNLLGGGAERIISILALYLSKRGFNVDLLLGNAIGPYLKNIPPSVNIIDLGCTKVMFTLPKLVSYLRENQPDLLFASQMHSSTMALWAAKMARVDTNVIVRQPTMLQPAFRKKTLNSKFRQKILLWSARCWSHKVVATSKMMADEFIFFSKISPAKVVVIHNPLPVAKIWKESEQALDHPWFGERQPPVILAVGRLVRVKDFETLIKAFKLVKEKVDARLMILGEGPLRAELEQLIQRLDLKSYVQLPGFAENPYRYMRRSKVFVMSSLWEGFPNGMVEAMACGANVVATSCDGGAIEILESGKWGKLVPVQSTREMALSIIDVLQSQELPNTKERAEHFAVNKIIDKYIELFAQ